MFSCVKRTDSKRHVQVVTGTGHNTEAGSGAEPQREGCGGGAPAEGCVEGGAPPEPIED